jgi:hypothetical protein
MSAATVEPETPFNVVRPRGVSPTCMWTVKAPLRRGFPLGCGISRAVSQLRWRRERDLKSMAITGAGPDAPHSRARWNVLAG